MKKVMNIKSWPKTVPTPTIDDVLRKKQRQRKERIKEAKENIDKIRKK